MRLNVLTEDLTHSQGDCFTYLFTQLVLKSLELLTNLIIFKLQLLRLMPTTQMEGSSQSLMYQLDRLIHDIECRPIQQKIDNEPLHGWSRSTDTEGDCTTSSSWCTLKHLICFAESCTWSNTQMNTHQLLSE